MSSPALVVVMAIIDAKMISLLELIGCVLGMYGALLMSNHKFFERNCFCCCFKEKTREWLNESETEKLAVKQMSER